MPLVIVAGFVALKILFYKAILGKQQPYLVSYVL